MDGRRFRVWGFLALTFFAACTPKILPKQMGDAKWGVHVTWHGHSCFSLRDSFGRTIVIDPYDDTVGFGRLNLKADALLVTHSHFDHDNRNAVKARLRQIDLDESTGTVSVASELWVTGIDSYHDDQKGAINGKNRIFVFQMGGLRFAHFGDLGQSKLDPLQVAMIGQVDVLMIPVGGVVTIDGSIAKKFVDQLKPKVVLPMHYGDIRFYHLKDLKSFTELFPPTQIKTIDGPSVQLKLTELPEQPTVYLLKPAERNE